MQASPSFCEALAKVCISRLGYHFELTNDTQFFERFSTRLTVSKDISGYAVFDRGLCPLYISAIWLGKVAQIWSYSQDAGTAAADTEFHE